METDTSSPAAPQGPSEGSTPPSACCGGNSKLPVVLMVAAVLVGALLAALRNRSGGTSAADERAQGSAAAAVAPEAWTPSPRPTGETVSLTIDFGNGARREFAALPYKQGMTLGELITQAREFRPPINFTTQGEGDMAFLTSLEGVANETGASGRYWVYSVDDRRGEVSFAVQSLAAKSEVLWEFRRGE